jgi:lipopolysaccharide transport system ATP-binding protein
MSRPAIVIEGLGKEYRLGQRGKHFPSFREAVANALRSPFKPRGADKAKTEVEEQDETFWALKDVSFEVHPGEVVGIIGRNGAGKSTMLKILSRITEPTEGSVRVRGRLASLLEVGTGFHPELTGRENIYLNGSILGMKKAEIDRKFDQIVAFAEIEKFIDTQVKHYSSGMYVRLAFAVAAHLEPQILIVDEVLAVGDAEFQKKCLGRIEEVTREGRTVLFVSHNMPALQNLCSRCIYLENGLLKLDGDPSALIEAYTQASISQLRSEEDLSRAPGRVRTFEPYLKSISVRGPRSDAAYVSMGDSIEVVVDFESPKPLNQVSLWVWIKNNMNMPIFGVDTDINPPDPIREPMTQGRIVCRIENLPLMPGTYSIDLYFGSRNFSLDEIRDACRFEVHAADVFGNGKTPLSVSGNIFWPATWEIREIGSAEPIGSRV